MSKVVILNSKGVAEAYIELEDERICMPDSQLAREKAHQDDNRWARQLNEHIKHNKEKYQAANLERYR